MFEWRVAASSPEILTEANGEPLTRSARRRASATGHVDGLTGLRGLAALVVVFVHGSGLTQYPWFGLHDFGPIALFVLSGFLLIQPWSKWIAGAGDKPSVRGFVRRRVWRIFPAYLVLIALTALLIPESRPVNLGGLIRSVTLTTTFDPHGLRHGLEHTWSLGTELTWYAIVPLVGAAAALLARRFWPSRPLLPFGVLLVVAVLISAAWRYYVDFHLTELGQKLTLPMWLPAFTFCFIGGATIGHMVVMKRHGRSTLRPLEWFASKPALVAFVALGAAAIGNSKLGGEWTYTPPTFAESVIRTVACTTVAVVLLVSVAVGPLASWVNRFFSMPWLVATGRWSYGIYLWHMPAMILLANEVPIDPSLGGLFIWIGLLLAVSIPLGALTYTFVEKPAIAWSKRTAQQPS